MNLRRANGSSEKVKPLSIPQLARATLLAIPMADEEKINLEIGEEVWVLRHNTDQRMLWCPDSNGVAGPWVTITAQYVFTESEETWQRFLKLFSIWLLKP